MSFDVGRTLRRLRLRHLELLARLGHERTLRATAREMSLTQPAVSKMLREIEENFGVPLFNRTPSGVVPTAAGLHLIREATVLVHHLARAGEDLPRQGEAGRHVLRVGTFSVIPRVPRAIAEVRRRHPQAVVLVREATVVAQLQALVDGEIDAIVGALPPEALLSPHIESVRIEPLADDALRVMVSTAHALATAAGLRWQDLPAGPWCLPPKTSLLRRAFIDRLMREGLPPPEPAVELLSPVLVTEMLLHDPTLLGLMRREQAEAEAAAGRLAVLDVQPEMALPPLALVTLKQHEARSALLNSLAKALFDRPG
jgi:DNA-binding transcriptional LysR family regulator